MSSDIIVAIISGAVTIIVGFAGGWFGYLGSIKGATKQIQHERDLILVGDRKQQDFAVSVIKSFLVEEIRTNFTSLIGRANGLTDRLRENDKPFDQDLVTYFSFDEFEKGKYELIKSNDILVREIIDIYKTFKILHRVGNVKELNVNEYKDFQRVYRICLEKYL